MGGGRLLDGFGEDEQRLNAVSEILGSYEDGSAAPVRSVGTTPGRKLLDRFGMLKSLMKDPIHD